MWSAHYLHRPWKVKKGIRVSFANVFLIRPMDPPLQKVKALHDIMALVATSVSAVIEPVWVDLAVSLLQVIGEEEDSMALLVENILAVPCFASFKGKIKGIFGGFGNSKANIMTFLPVRSIYFLAGMQAARDEIDTHLPSASSSGDVAVLLEAKTVLSNAFSIMRRMARQISSIDIEFAEENPLATTVSSDEDKPGSGYNERWVYWRQICVFEILDVFSLYWYKETSNE